MNPRSVKLRGFVLLAVTSALLVAGCGGKESRLKTTGSGDPPVIIVSIDTLRADYVGAYGGKVEMPALDAIAKDGILFENAYAQVPLTLPSHAAILTGLLPEQTGVRSNLGYRFDGSKHPSIPSLLKARGYWTGAAVSAYVLRRATGLGDIFDAYSDDFAQSVLVNMAELQRPGPDTIAAARTMLAGHETKPHFFLLHLFEPHTPYAPPEPYRSKYGTDLYAGEVATADAALGTFVEYLKSAGIYDRALIIVLSDHGEGLGDHGEPEHGIFLYREAIHVPLLVKLPGGEMSGSRVATPVQLGDIMPTVAEVVGFKSPEGVSGTSLLAIARGAKPDRRIVAETMYPRIHLGWSDLLSLIDDKHHYIHAPKPELYDVVADPKELTNAMEANRRVFTAMRSEAEKHPRRLELPSQVDPEEAEKLKALGYIGSVASQSSGSDLPDPKDRIGDLQAVAESEAAVRRGDYPAAIAILRAAVERNPTFADAWSFLARAYIETGRLEEALEAKKKVIEVAPVLATSSAVSIAEIYLALGRIDEAIANAQLGMGTHPAAAKMVLGRAYLAQKNFDAAEREAMEIVNDPASKYDAKILLAKVRLGQKRVPEALAIADAVGTELQAGQKPPVRDLSLVRGDALARLGRLPEAEQALLQECRAFPTNREAYVVLAGLQLVTGRDAEANRTFEAMVAANPEPISYRLAARTFASLGRTAAAESWQARMGGR